MAKQLKITQVKSEIGWPEKQRLVLRGLGLGKVNRTVLREDTPETRGMVAKIPHLLKVEEVEK